MSQHGGSVSLPGHACLEMEPIRSPGAALEQGCPPALHPGIPAGIEGLGGEPERLVRIHPGTFRRQVEILVPHFGTVLGLLHGRRHLLEHLPHRTRPAGAQHRGSQCTHTAEEPQHHQQFQEAEARGPHGTGGADGPRLRHETNLPFKMLARASPAERLKNVEPRSQSTPRSIQKA